MKTTNSIRKELAILIKTKKAEIPDITKKQENIIVETSRQEINLKYGKGWRDSLNQTIRPCDDETSPYYGHENGEYWMD